MMSENRRYLIGPLARIRGASRCGGRLLTCPAAPISWTPPKPVLNPTLECMLKLNSIEVDGKKTAAQVGRSLEMRSSDQPTPTHRWDMPDAVLQLMDV